MNATKQKPAPAAAEAATADPNPGRIQVEIRPEQAAIVTREHQQMTATIQQAQSAFLHSLALLAAGRAPDNAAFVGLETGPDGGPVLVFDTAA